MNILAALKREERKLEKELGKLNHKLDGVRAAGKALGRSTGRELKVHEEAGIVRGWQGQDREGGQEALGKDPRRSEKSYKLEYQSTWLGPLIFETAGLINELNLFTGRRPIVRETRSHPSSRFWLLIHTHRASGW